MDDIASSEKQLDSAENIVPLFRQYIASVDPGHSNDADTNLTDLLADIMHWSAVNGVDFDAALGTASRHFTAESVQGQEKDDVAVVSDGPDYVVTVDRRYTIQIFGTLEGYVALADGIGERLDSLDAGDATGAVLLATSESGQFEKSHEGVRVVASFADDLFQWTPQLRP